MVEHGALVVVCVVKFAEGVFLKRNFSQGVQVSPEEGYVCEWVFVVSLDRHKPHGLVETICFGHGGWNGIEIHGLEPFVLRPGNCGFHQEPSQPKATECAVDPETLHLARAFFAVDLSQGDAPRSDPIDKGEQ